MAPLGNADKEDVPQVHPGHCQPKHPPPVLEVFGQEQVLLGLQAGKLGRSCDRCLAKKKNSKPLNWI